MKIYVLGYKGMLGNYTYNYLKSKKHNVIGVSRNELDSEAFNQVQLHGALFQKGFKKGDVIINCMGTLKSQINDGKASILTAIKVNSLFPHYLSNISQKEGYKLIHITTDCVFSGYDGLYDEKAEHDCTDIYGKTKSLGEPTNCTVIRSSIIGEEFGQSRSLIEWVKSKKDQSAQGYTNHFWNGITCLQMAKIFENIIVNNLYWSGVRHIFSPNSVTKYELVQMISDVYQLNIQLTPVETKVYCNRILTTIFNDIIFDIPDIKDQIEEQFNYFHVDMKNK